MNKEFLFGVNMHNSGYKAYPEHMLDCNIAMCDELAVNIIRMNIDGYSDESVGYGKRMISECHSRNMKFMLVIDSRTFIDMPKEKVAAFYEDYFYKIAFAYGDELDYIQVFNELDVIAMRGDIANIIIPGGDGIVKENYDSELWDKSILAVKGAMCGIKKSGSKVKTCINFAWWHTALLYEIVKQGIDFDIVGIDWYSDCENISSIEKLIEDIEKNIPDKDMIIVETNYWMHPMSRDPIEVQEAIKDEMKRDKAQAEWIPAFTERIYKMDNQRLKGIIIYELLDEIIYDQQQGKYYGEAHFGLVKCDINGENPRPKQAFYSYRECIKKLKRS